MSCDKLSDLTRSIVAVSTLEDLEIAIADAATACGFVDAAYYRLTRLGEPVLPTIVFGASFEAFVQVYIAKGYARTDPVVMLGFREDLPFTAGEVAHVRPQPPTLHTDRQKLWGIDGLFCPISSSFGEVGVMGWRADRELKLSDEDRMAMHALSRVILTTHRRIVLENVLPNLPMQPFTPRESESVFWISQGRTTAEVAEILKLSVHTVRQYIDSAIEKLGAKNRGQMLLRASVLGLVTSEVRQD